MRGGLRESRSSVQCVQLIVWGEGQTKWKVLIMTSAGRHHCQSLLCDSWVAFTLQSQKSLNASRAASAADRGNHSTSSHGICQAVKCIYWFHRPPHTLNRFPFPFRSLAASPETRRQRCVSWTSPTMRSPSATTRSQRWGQVEPPTLGYAAACVCGNEWKWVGLGVGPNLCADQEKGVLSCTSSVAAHFWPPAIHLPPVSDGREGNECLCVGGGNGH